MTLTICEIIEDLKAVQASFEQETGGSTPLCIPEAIKILEALNTIKEA